MAREALTSPDRLSTPEVAIVDRGGGRRVLTTAGPWPAGDSRLRSRRGPRVQPFTLDPGRPCKSSRDYRKISTQRSCYGGRPGSRRAAGLTLGGRLRIIRAFLPRTQPRQHPHLGYRVARQPPGALAKRSGSERWPEVAAARPGRVGPA
jgi:hypothetical protein